MRQELEPIVDGASTDLFSAPAEPSEAPGGELRDAVGPARSQGLGVARKTCIACSFTVTLLLPALSIATLVTVKPILPASAQPVGALTFVLVFAYLRACLFAIGEITARP